MNSLISDYKELIVLFTDKKEISALEFETEFLKLFKSDKSCDENFYEIIKPLFYAVEDFCSDSEIREDDDLDENQLAEAAKGTLDKLEKLYIADDKNLQPVKDETNIKQLLTELNELINNLPLLIDRIVEEKLNEILPVIVKNTLSEELHTLDANSSKAVSSKSQQS
ncbi:colicin immunity domain-containing protein [Desulfonema magnum]|uniref:Colicin D immunity protein domain-containing protein n=1 Tax=Desulfonema magnum TaxID=45655 RepID=A0A975BP62_9BACT|nr:colicin immunity domain-containing protein [Desulfonema magnum]QTA88862.1 Colicin D immunity protein domain-containing protein [Desulfonema magnum]